MVYLGGRPPAGGSRECHGRASQRQQRAWSRLALIRIGQNPVGRKSAPLIPVGLISVRCHEEPGCHRHRARAPVLRVQFCLSSGASEWRGSAPNRPYRCGDNQLRPPAGQCPLHSTSAVPGSAPLRVDAIIGFLRWRVGDTRNRSLHLRAWQVGYDCGAKRRRSTNPRTVARRSQSAGMPTWHLTTRCRRTKPSWHAICGRTWRASSPLPLSASVRAHSGASRGA